MKRFFAIPCIFVFVVLSFFLSPANLCAGEVTLKWNSNTEPHVAGYKIHYGFGSRAYTRVVNAGHVTQYTLNSLDHSKTHYFAATAYDASGNESAYSSELVLHWIKLNPGAGGSISPGGTHPVQRSSSRTFTITPDSGYDIADVTVDGVSVGAVDSYTFQDVSSNHAIAAFFVPHKPSHVTPSFVISSQAGPHGSVTPSGQITVAEGESQSFSIVPAENHVVKDVVVNGESRGPLAQYVFSDVRENHTLFAHFKLQEYLITASGGENGGISPSGTLLVSHGGSQSFIITPREGYRVKNVLVDGNSMGPLSQYTFTAVTGPRSISALFKPLNDPPVADAGPDQVVGENSLVTLSAHNSHDPHGDSLTYSWKQTGGPSVVLSSPHAAAPTFQAPHAGSDGEALTFQLTVTDPHGAQSVDTCIVNVSWANKAPAACAGKDQLVTPSSRVVLDGSLSSDPDDGIKSYLWEQIGSGPPVSLSDPRSARPEFFAPEIDQEGVALTFRLTVTDAGGLKSTDTCVVNVSRLLEGAPTAHAGSDQVVYPGGTILLDGSPSHSFVGIASWRWTQTRGAPADIQDPAAMSPQVEIPSDVEPGSVLTFRLAVTDEAGLKSFDQCRVEVHGEDGPHVKGTWSSLAFHGDELSGHFILENFGNETQRFFTVSFYESHDGRTRGPFIHSVFVRAVVPGFRTVISGLGQFGGQWLKGQHIISVMEGEDKVLDVTRVPE